MAITQTLCTSFKVALLSAEMDFSADTADVFKIALYTDVADLGAATTAYTTDNEVSGTGYIAGGATLTISTNPTSSGTIAYAGFSDVTWASASFSARGALIYKSGGSNPAVAVLNFGQTYTSSGGNFVLRFPSTVANSAIIRIA